MDREIYLPYGDSLLKIRIPEDNVACVLERHRQKGIENEAEAITESLREPIGSPPLIDCLSTDDKVVVIVTDNTRACPEDRLLPAILAELERKISRDNITVIIALGLHHPLDKAALIKKVGKGIVEKYRVINHDANDTVSIGITPRGTQVDINRAVVEADFRISTGYIEPHLFAGFSGGRKSIAPGVLGARSIHKNHGYQMLDHPLARPGILKGNPVHEDMVDMAKMANLNFIVNVLLNKKREITNIVAGDPYEAHEEGCRIEKENATFKIMVPPLTWTSTRPVKASKRLRT
ncbi:nickel-dependent lactate racemase [Chloroflexota bacterium]